MSRRIVYWISTMILCLLYLTSAMFYMLKGDAVRPMLGALGYPGYLVPILIVAKLAGVATILSRFKVALSDLAYAGMLYHLLLAASAHLNAHDYRGVVPAVVGLLMLGISWVTQNAARGTPSPYAP